MILKRDAIWQQVGAASRAVRLGSLDLSLHTRAHGYSDSPFLLYGRHARRQSYRGAATMNRVHAFGLVNEYAPATLTATT